MAVRNFQVSRFAQRPAGMADGILPGHGHELWRPEAAAPAFPFHLTFESLRYRDKVSHVVRSHHHRHYEFLLIDAGEYRGVLAGQEFVVPAGRAVMLAPGDVHTDRCGTPIRFRAVTVRATPGPDAQTSAALLAATTTAAQRQVDIAAAGLDAVITAMLLTGKRADSYAVFAMDALAMQFVCSYLAGLPAEAVSPRLVQHGEAHAFWSELHAAFDRHLEQGLALDTVAAELHISKRTLTARCQEHFQASPIRLFTRYRMERARDLLLQTDRPIKEISSYFGFEDQYHFSKVYKRTYGTSPSADRDSSQASSDWGRYGTPAGTGISSSPGAR